MSRFKAVAEDTGGTTKTDEEKICRTNEWSIHRVVYAVGLTRRGENNRRTQTSPSSFGDVERSAGTKQRSGKKEERR